MDVEKAFDQLNKSLLTPEFLQRVEKWARYDGKKFDIGDIDIVVENMGTFTIVSDIPDISTKNGKLVVNKKTKKHYTIYDVTKVKNNAVCSDYDVRILIAERQQDWMDDLYKSYRPAKLFIYSIFIEGSNKIESTYFPSFETLKSDFESGKYTHYQSMIKENFDDYLLIPFNDETDRIRNFSSIQMDLECLECDKTSIKLSKHIKVSPRLNKEEREKAYELYMENIRKKCNENYLR